MFITNLRLSHKVLIIFVSVFWIALFVILIKCALKWDHEKQLESQDMYGNVADNSPEQHYP